MVPFPQQKHIYGYNKWTIKLVPFFKWIFPPIHLQQLAQAMINVTLNGNSKTVFEVNDIKALL